MGIKFRQMSILGYNAHKNSGCVENIQYKWDFIGVLSLTDVKTGRKTLMN